MRIASLSLLLMSTISLTACGGAGSTLIEMNDRCGTLCPKTVVNDPPPPPIVSPLPPPSTVNTGNNTEITTGGDTTIILEKGVLVSTKNNPALAILTPETGTGTTEKTKTVKLAIDTKDAERNSSWPVPKTMEWTRFGTQNEYSTDVMTNGAIVASTLAAPGSPATSGSLQMGHAGLNGTQVGQAIYNEYTAYSSDPENNPFDEELQIWTWGKSYASQYRDVTGGGSPAAHQAWTYGAANGAAKSTLAQLPTSGVLTMRGAFTTTAETRNFEQKKQLAFQTMENNGLWSTSGAATTTINYNDTSNIKVSSALNLDFVRKDQDTAGEGITALAPDSVHIGIENGFAYVDVNQAKADLNLSASAIDLLPIQRRINLDNFRANSTFMDTQIILEGKLTATATGNNITNGTATLSGNGWRTNSTTNIFHGSVFGDTPAGQEFTGIFNVESLGRDPVGGNTGIEDDGRGYVDHSGIVHGDQLK